MADIAMDMRFFENRIASFGEQDHPAKKVQTSQGKGVPKSWPHETPTARDLAYAGFYFAPTSHNHDNVKCFQCEVKLDGWEIDDNAIREHVAHSSSCAWAVVTSVSLGDEDRDPLSEKLLSARLDTFGTSWPYEKKRGWKPKSKKLAEAGWCMDPSLGAEDGATCHYCQLSLNGWEPKDDPLEEHRTRRPNCAFFRLLERYASTRPKKGRARNSTASKASRLSTQSIQSTFSEAPSFMSLGEAAPTFDADTTVGTITSTTSTAKGRKKPTTTKKSARGKKQPADDTDITEMATALTNLDETLAPSQTLFQSTQEESPIEAKKEPAKKATRGKGKGKKAVATIAEETEDLSQVQLQSELAASIVEPEVKKPATKSKRGKKRTSDGEEKPEATQEDMLQPSALEDAATMEGPAPKTKKAKTTRAKKTKVPQDEPLNEDQPGEQAQQMEIDAPEAAVTAEAAKPKRGTRKAKAKPVKEPTPQPEPEPQAEEPMEDESANYVVQGEEEDDDEPNFVVHDESSANFIVHDQTPEPEQGEFEPTPTPQKAPAARDPIHEQPASTDSTPHSVRSHQSSDAENHPPSSNAQTSKRISATPTFSVLPPAPSPPLNIAQVPVIPAPQMSPVKTTRVPLATQTPNRSPSRISPTKLGHLNTRTPWTATDIETIFFSADGQENVGTGVAKRLAALGGQLSSPEKKMTVEDWVRFQAVKGEERLREECERLVWLFEQEGTRAMAVLEGVEVRSET